MYVIATSPRRLTNRRSNAVQKFAAVQPNGKFRWVTSLDNATLFTSSTDLLYAIGVRARALTGRFQPRYNRNGGLTHDVTWAEVERAGVRIKVIANGS